MKYLVVVKNMRLSEEAAERTAERYEFKTYGEARGFAAYYAKKYALHAEVFKRLPRPGPDGLRIVGKCIFDYSGDWVPGLTPRR